MGVIMRTPLGSLIEVDIEEAEALEGEGYIYHVPRCAICCEVVDTEPLGRTIPSS